MKLRAVLELGLLALSLPSVASAAASWGYGDASITIQGKAAAAAAKKQPYGFPQSLICLLFAALTDNPSNCI
jgi:hypothetical protein